MKTLICNVCGKIITETSLQDETWQLRFEPRITAPELREIICVTLDIKAIGVPLDFHLCQECFRQKRDNQRRKILLSLVERQDQLFSVPTLRGGRHAEGVLHSLECAWRICHHEWVEDKCRKCGALNGGAQPEDFKK